MADTHILPAGFRRLSLAWMCGAAITLGTGPAVAAGDAKTAEAAVMQFYDQVSEMARHDTCAHRAAFLEPAVAATYDIPNYLRESLRGHWRELAGQDTADLEALVQHLIATTYAANFTSAKGLRVHVGDVAYEDRYRRSVGVRIERPGEPVSHRRYLLHRSEDGKRWRVINLFFPQGPSELVYRARYNEENLRWGGFDALRKYLRDEASRFGVDC